MPRTRAAARSRGLNEASAREVLLLQAVESVVPPGPSWTADDAAWATRVARDPGAGSATRPAAGSTGGPAAGTAVRMANGSADGAAETFFALRAAAAMRRLLPREPVLAAALGARLWRPGWAAAAAAAGFFAGLVAHEIGDSQHINLLAPPVWGVVVWNLSIYLLLIVAVARQVLSAPSPGRGRIVRLTERLMRLARGRLPATPETGPTAAALRAFNARWWTVGATLSAQRASTLLHLAAATLGLGLIAGLYLRGLVLDYRVGWESTFLSAASVHAVLATLFAPASLLSGIALPGVADVAALRSAHGGGAVGAPAADWLHLLAGTVLIAVVLPRAALAAFSAARASWSASHLRLPLDDAYFRRLLRQAHGGPTRVHLVPYAQTPSPQTIAALRALLVDTFGDGSTFEVAPTTRFGDDDDGARLPAPPAGTTLVAALFDLGATPEPEHQGRFATALAAAAAPGTLTIVVVDATAFAQRFGRDHVRLAERRAAWSTLVEALGGTAVFIDAGADPVTDIERLQAALGQPLAAQLPP